MQNLSKEMVMENQEMGVEKSWKIHVKKLCQVCGNPDLGLGTFVGVGLVVVLVGVQ